MNFSETDEFTKEFKRLSKKYRSLPEDLAEFKKVASVFPLGAGKHAAVLYRGEVVVIIKSRLACRYLRGSTLRVVYAYLTTHNSIDFMEIYFKGDKENENRARIREYVNKLEKSKEETGKT